MYRTVTGVTSNVGEPSTYLVIVVIITIIIIIIIISVVVIANHFAANSNAHLVILSFKYDNYFAVNKMMISINVFMILKMLQIYDLEFSLAAHVHHTTSPWYPTHLPKIFRKKPTDNLSVGFTNHTRTQNFNLQTSHLL